MNDLDPRLFSELEIEALTGRVRPWRKFVRFLKIAAYFAVLIGIAALAIHELRRWSVI